MKKLLFAILFAGFSFASHASVAVFRLDEAALDQKLSTAAELTFSDLTQAELLKVQEGASVSGNGGKNAWVAFLLADCFGYLGIHRLYLGTSPLVVVGYILTAGGCGILYIVDTYILWFAAIQDKNINKYTKCKKFFMWAC
jgi:hypothetical protein